MNYKKSILILGTAFLGLVIVASQFIRGAPLYSICLGYLLFASNLLLVAWLGEQAVQNMTQKPGKRKSRPKWLVGGLGIVKFAGLATILYLAVVQWQLPIIYFAGGAGIAMIVFVWIFVSDYLHKLSAA